VTLTHEAIPPLVAARVMELAPAVTVIPVPAVNVAAAGAAPVAPITICPLLKVRDVRGEVGVAPAMVTPLMLKELDPVPPLATPSGVDNEREFKESVALKEGLVPVFPTRTVPVAPTAVGVERLLETAPTTTRNWVNNGVEKAPLPL